MAAPFDRRVQKEFDLIVKVSDNSSPPKMNRTQIHIIIDDSNTAPDFVDDNNITTGQYSFSVGFCAFVLIISFTLRKGQRYSQ